MSAILRAAREGRASNPASSTRTAAEEIPAAQRADALLARLRERAASEDVAWIRRDPLLRARASPATAPLSPPSDALLSAARAALASTNLVEVAETVKFAGSTVTVTTTVTAAAAAPESADSGAGANELDHVVDTLAKRRGVTTVEKSSYDWEAYKREKQLQDELKDAAKTGFVEKEAFLHRVDERQFGLERAERERARIKRELAAARAARGES